jgi:selenocysteine lyase/cysteine desulfurase
MRRVYLDYNATTPIAPEVLGAMLPYFGEEFGNASSIHTFGQRGRDAVEQARAAVAKLLGARRSADESADGWRALGGGWRLRRWPGGARGIVGGFSSPLQLLRYAGGIFPGWCLSQVCAHLDRRI